MQNIIEGRFMPDFSSSFSPDQGNLLIPQINQKVTKHQTLNRSMNSVPLWNLYIAAL